MQGTLGLSALRQRVNNPLDPLRGTILSGSLTWSSRVLGSSATQQFFRMVGDVSGFVPLTRSVVLAAHLRGGIIFAPQINVSDSSIGNFVPPDQRFYAGGAYDVRGYDQNELGPLVYVVPADSIDPTKTPQFTQTSVHVAPIGGTRVAIGNVELRLPTPFFAGRLRAAVFVDAGMLSNTDGPAPIRITPGAGLRYTSPIGPIRIDVGYNTHSAAGGTALQDQHRRIAVADRRWIRQAPQWQLDLALFDRPGVLMRVIRRIIAALLTPLVILVAVIVGTTGAIVFTAPGHALLARIASKWITGAVAGGMEIGAIRGNIWNHIELDRVVVRDPRGAGDHQHARMWRRAISFRACWRAAWCSITCGPTRCSCTW